MKGDDIAERLLKLATNIIAICSKVPKSMAATIVVRQLLRCGTSGGANYEEARSAESRQDFAHKALVAAKETSETNDWLKVLRSSGLSSSPLLEPSIRESRELTAILKASAATAKRNAS